MGTTLVCDSQLGISQCRAAGCHYSERSPLCTPLTWLVTVVLRHWWSWLLLPCLFLCLFCSASQNLEQQSAIMLTVRQSTCTITYISAYTPTQKMYTENYTFMYNEDISKCVPQFRDPPITHLYACIRVSPYLFWNFQSIYSSVTSLPPGTSPKNLATAKEPPSLLI